QTAYQIQVATSPEKLRESEADLWDSGRPASADFTEVAYAGRTLGSGALAHWQVRLWDGDGRVSAWSRPARWPMGLLRDAAWYVRGHPGVIHDGPLVRAQIDVRFADGSVEKLATDTTWKVRFSPITPLGRGTAFGDYGGEHYDARLELADWNATTLDDSDWQPA